MVKEKIVLPPDVYDTLEFVAEVYGGVGAYEFVEREEETPCCVLGLASHADPSFHLLEQIRERGVRPFQNDIVVEKYLLDHPRRKRMPFRDWAKKMHVVRGAP